ncbi:MAG: hypothetical protein JXQ23_06605 [Clostridia bacterium]|nr:hypothetical protein [Clostridia bacterium]
MSELLEALGKSNVNLVILSLISIVLVIAVFLIIRELVCWYYKINQITKLLSDISKKLDHCQIMNESVSDGEMSQTKPLTITETLSE